MWPAAWAPLGPGDGAWACLHRCAFPGQGRPGGRNTLWGGAALHGEILLLLDALDVVPQHRVLVLGLRQLVGHLLQLLLSLLQEPLGHLALTLLHLDLCRSVQAGATEGGSAAATPRGPVLWAS